MKIISNERSATSSILIILGLFLISSIFLSGIVQIAILLIDGVRLEDFISGEVDFFNIPNAWLVMIVSQGIASFLTFIATTVFYWKIIEKKDLNLFNSKPFPIIQVLILALLIQITSSFFNGWLQEINKNVALPEFLKSLETSLRFMEDLAEKSTDFMTNFTSFWQFLMAFLVIAVIAGIGEELLFRGLILRKLFIGTNNIHLAIWGSAVIFSAIHFQFYGFLPRTILGAMFGYFYYWTGNIWVPIIAHIFNNGLIVVMIYLKNLGMIDVDIETMDGVSATAIISSLVVSIGLMIFMKKSTNQISD